MRISGRKCEKCGLLTCLRHRTFEAHCCAVWLEEKRRVALKETTGAELSRPHTATCRRAVRMMNTRKTSVGKPNLEASERLDVVAQNTPLRDGAPLKRYYMHFPKAWSVSRVVDALAVHFDLPNPHSSVKPWALVNVSRVGQLLTQLAQSLEDAGVQNGDVLTLVNEKVCSTPDFLLHDAMREPAAPMRWGLGSGVALACVVSAAMLPVLCGAAVLAISRLRSRC